VRRTSMAILYGVSLLLHASLGAGFSEIEPEKEPEEEKKEEPAAPEPTPVEPVVRFLAKKNIPELTSNEKLSS